MTHPAKGHASPWGPIQTVERFADGVYFIGTAAHGGFFVDAERNAAVSERGREYASAWSHGWGSQWYEEDCAAAYVLVAFPDAFDAETVKRAEAEVERIEGGVQ